MVEAHPNQIDVF
jgi:serine/threonine protein kinase